MNPDEILERMREGVTPENRVPALPELSEEAHALWVALSLDVQRADTRSVLVMGEPETAILELVEMGVLKIIGYHGKYKSWGCYLNCKLISEGELTQ